MTLNNAYNPNSNLRFDAFHGAPPGTLTPRPVVPPPTRMPSLAATVVTKALRIMLK